MATDVQSYRNHRQFVPGFHFVTVSLLLVYFGWTIYRLFVAFSADAVFSLLLAVALLLLAWYVRSFANRLQDRIIRLETRLRLERLLPGDLTARIPELTVAQLIALRFAGDAELPELTRRCLTEPLTGREEIKRQIHQWQADDLRV